MPSLPRKSQRIRIHKEPTGPSNLPLDATPTPKRKVMTGAERARLFRLRTKEDPEKYDLYLQKNAQLCKSYRDSLSVEEKMEYNRKGNERAKKAKAKKKEEQGARPTKRLTAKKAQAKKKEQCARPTKRRLTDVTKRDEQRQKWKEEKRKQRQQMHWKTCEAINADRRAAYRAKKEAAMTKRPVHQIPSVPHEDSCTPVAKRQAVQRMRLRDVLPRSPTKFAATVLTLIHSASPRKKTLWRKGVSEEEEADNKKDQAPEIDPETTYRYRRLELMQSYQQMDECLDDFVNRVRPLAALCQFTTADTEARIVELIIATSPLDDLRRMLLLKDESLTLDEAVQLGRACEAVLLEQVCAMDNSEGADQAADNGGADKSYTEKILSLEEMKKEDDGTNGKMNKNDDTMNCRNCGEFHSFNRRKYCPAFDKNCSMCGKIGHNAKCCFSKSNFKSLLSQGGADKHFSSRGQFGKPKFSARGRGRFNNRGGNNNFVYARGKSSSRGGTSNRGRPSTRGGPSTAQEGFSPRNKFSSTSYGQKKQFSVERPFHPKQRSSSSFYPDNPSLGSSRHAPTNRY